MAQVIEVKTARGAGMMLRGKLGNQVFQIRNGKQVVAKMPKERTTPPTKKEIEHRQRFATLKVQRQDVLHVARIRLRKAEQGMDVGERDMLWIILYMMYRIWYGIRTITICRPVGVGFGSSTKPLSMITLSPGTKGYPRNRREKRPHKSTAFPPSACTTACDGTTKKPSDEKDTIF